MNDRLAVLKREPRLLLLPREHGRRHDAVDVDRVAHVRQRLDGGVGIDDDPASIVQDRAAERAEVLEKDRDQPFVAGALPDEPERDPVVPSCARRASCASSSRSRGARGARSVRQYSMPTSTNHGSAYSAPFQRSAATAAAKNRSTGGSNRSRPAIHPAAANSGVQTTSSCRTSGSLARAFSHCTYS